MKNFFEKIPGKNPEQKKDLPEADFSGLDSVLDDFEKKTFSKENFEELAEKIQALKKNREAFENCWDQSKIDRFLSLLDKASWNLAIEIPDYFEDTCGLLCDAWSDDPAQANQLNLKVAQAFLSRLGKEGGFSDFDLNLASCLGRDFFSGDPEADNFFYQSFFGESQLFSNLREFLEKNPDDFDTHAKIIKTLEFFSPSHEEDVDFRPGKEMEMLMDSLAQKTNYFSLFGLQKTVFETPWQKLDQNTKEKLQKAYGEEIFDPAFADLIARKELAIQMEKRHNDKKFEQGCPPELFPEKSIVMALSAKENLGAVHSFEGEALGFFDADVQKQQTLKDLLEKAGFPEQRDDQGNYREEYRALLLNFQSFSALPFREKIEDEFNIKLENFSLRQQVQLVNFLVDEKPARKITNFDDENNLSEAFPRTEKLKKMLLQKDQKESNDFLKSFLSMEIDFENGNRILAIGEKLPTQDADKIFAKIAGLCDVAQEKDEELKKIIFKDEKGEVLPDMRTELLLKAHGIIVRFAEELGGEGEVDDSKIQKLLGDLEKSGIEIDLVSSLLIAMKKQGEFQKLEEIKGIEIETVMAEELLSQKDLEKKLEEMYRFANAHKSKEDLERLMRDFENHKTQNAKFRLIYFDKAGKSGKNLENLAGFVRTSSFDGEKELSEGERYLGAMNISPILQRFYFGENFLREVMEKEISSGAKKLIAHVPENEPSHKIAKVFKFEDAGEEGEYRNDEGKVMAKRIRIEWKKP
jgi:hypothetical protein